MAVHTQQCQDDSPFLSGRSDAPSSVTINPFVLLPHDSQMLRLPLRRCASASSDSSPAAVFRETHQNHQTCRDRLQFVKKQYQKRLEIMRAAFDVRLNNAKAEFGARDRVSSSLLDEEMEHVCGRREEEDTDDIMKAIQRDDQMEEIRSLKMLLSRQENEMNNLRRVIWTQETLLTRMRIELDKCQAHCQVPRSDREINPERDLKSLAAYRVSTVSKPQSNGEPKANDILMEEQLRLFFEQIDRCANVTNRTVTVNGSLPTATTSRRRKILGKVKQKTVTTKNNKSSQYMNMKSTVTVTPATAITTSLTARDVNNADVETVKDFLSRSSIDSCLSLRNEEPRVDLASEPAFSTIEGQADTFTGHQTEFVTDATVPPQPKRLVRTLPSLQKQQHVESQRFDSPVIRVDESDGDMDVTFHVNQSVPRAEVKPFSICITAHTTPNMHSTEAGKSELESDSTKEVWQSVESIDSELKSDRPFEYLLTNKRSNERDVAKFATDIAASEENKRELSESSNHGVSTAAHSGLISKRRLVEPIKNFNFPNYSPILCESVRSDPVPEGNTSASLRSPPIQHRTDSQTTSIFKRSRRSLSGAVTSPLSFSFPHVENQHPNTKPISLNKVSKSLADAVCPPVRLSSNTVPPRANMSIEPRPPGNQPGHQPGSQLGRRRRRALTVGCDMDFASLPLGPLTM